MSGKLTAKQALFVQEFLVDKNATQAALRAGYSLLPASRGGYYVYFLCDPESGSVFYVGKGRDRRMSTHTKKAFSDGASGNGAKNKKIQEIVQKGQAVSELIFADALDESAAFSLERELIHLLKAHGLTNISAGIVTHQESAMAYAQAMLKRLKSFEQWNSEMAPAERERIERIFGDPKEFYGKYKSSLERLSCHVEEEYASL